MQQFQRVTAQPSEANGYPFGLTANSPSAIRNWVVDITLHDGSQTNKVIEARESWDALEAADTLVPEAAHRVVRPLVELTEREGRNRYPGALHARATSAAHAGWNTRAAVTSVNGRAA